MKMYVLVKKMTPRGLAINSVGHAVLGTYLKFKDHPETIDWLENSYRKVTCLVSEEEFEEAKQAGDYEIFTESDYYDKEIAIGFRPRVEWPECFRKFKLFS